MSIFKKGDYVFRITPASHSGQYEITSEVINTTVWDNDGCTTYYMLWDIEGGQESSAWENQLVPAIVIESPLWKALS